MTKEIQLTKGLVALVDDCDYEELSKHKWYAAIGGKGSVYAARRNTDRKLIFMHREILKPDPGMFTDHVNTNTLDNRRSNLRPCTKAQNNRNTRKNRRNKSGYKGVCKYKKQPGTWQAMIKHNGIRIWLGIHKTQELAAHAYDEAAQKYHREFARLNF